MVPEEPTVPEEEQEQNVEDIKVNWEEEGTPQDEGEDASPLAGVQVGLNPLGVVIMVTDLEGKTAQKIISIDEAQLLAGQLLGFSSFLINMNIQAQLMEQQQLQNMMRSGEKKTPGGVYVK